MISILESRFGHVVERLAAAWGDPVAFQDLFDDLIFDKRGNRGGWPADVWEELQFLSRLHKLAYPLVQSESGAEADEPLDDDIKWV